MKAVNMMRIAGGIAAVLFALHVNAQSSDASGTAPVPASKAANRALAKRVRHVLARTKGLDPTHIYVKVVGGTITLSGSAETSDQIDLAVKAAEGVDGVMDVKNALSVRSQN
jgi:hyperosmotically inducible periplasmic protein